MKVNVIDSIAGSGKTSAAINMMNDDIGGNYIFITPFLKEVDRIKENCKERRFIEPENRGKGKLDSLHHLIGKGYNIASTHALFKTYDTYTKELIEFHEVKLILDEVFNVLEPIPAHKDDINILLETGLITLDENDYVIWNDENYEGDKFKEIKMMANNHNLLLIDNVLLLWNFPVDVFQAFKEVYILTYLFDAQVQKYYYDMNGVEMNYLGIKNNNGVYNFTKIENASKHTSYIKTKIKILDNCPICHIREIVELIFQKIGAVVPTHI
jgi:hypothetical protein